MSLLPDSASFHERVQDLFVAFRARGVSLSSIDVELVEAWAETGVPFDVVARGIRKAAEAALWDAPQGEGPLRSLTSARRNVELEIKKYLQRAAGKTEPGGPDQVPFHLVRHQKLLSALKKLGKEAPALVNLGWLAQLPPPADFDEANRQEDLVLAKLLRALPFAHRLALLREARRLGQNTGAMSAAARRESLRFHRAALVRREVKVPSFW